MKLELRHLAPYLPYGLKYFIDFEDGDTAWWTVEGLTIQEIFIDGYDCNYESKNCKPILRPLSDLTKEIDKDEDVTFLDWIESEYEIDVLAFIDSYSIEKLPYEVMEYLFEWHFDIFNLIENNLAIDINTLK